MTAESLGSAPSLGWETLRAEFERELKLEDARIFFPLLDRVVEIAAMLAEGQPVDPADIDAGIALWERYATEVHAERVSILSGIFSTKPSVAPPAPEEPRRGRFRRAKASTSKAEPTGDPRERFSQILADQTRMAERRNEFARLVDAYRRGQYWAREMLASLLRSSAFSDRAWAQYEEEFLEKFFDEHLDRVAEERLRSGLAITRERRASLEGEVQAFLARPVSMT